MVGEGNHPKLTRIVWLKPIPGCWRVFCVSAMPSVEETMPLKAMSREELQQSPEEHSHYPATSRLWTHMSKALSIAAVCGVILVIACVFRVDKVPHSQASESMEKWDQSDASGQCGLMEKNLDYVEYSGWGKNLDHIPDPDMCCAFCQAEPKCKSFVWVEDAGLDGCPSQCWLKGGEPSDKKPKDGVVSGMPPPRQAFHIAPQEASPDQFPVRRAGMFCFSLMLPFGYEVELLAWQYAHQVSIFDCEKFAVYTNKSMEVGSGTGASVQPMSISWDMHRAHALLRSIPARDDLSSCWAAAAGGRRRATASRTARGDGGGDSRGGLKDIVRANAAHEK
eukprot:s1035_g2.t1